MPPRGWVRAHLPLFKTETWDFERFLDEVCCYSFGADTSYSKLSASDRKLVLIDIADGLARGYVNIRSNLIVAPLTGEPPVSVQFSVESTFWSDFDPLHELNKFLSKEGNVIPYSYLFVLIEDKNFI